MSEEAKAVKEVAKSSGKAIDAGCEMARFIGRIIGGPLEQAAGIWEDRLKYARSINQLKLRDKFEEHLAKRGLSEPTRAVPMSFAVPLLQAAILEENDYLQNMWTAMLINAGDERVDVQFRRAFVSILEDMTSLDVKILKTIGDAQPLETQVRAFGGGFYVGYLPEEAAPMVDFQPNRPYPSKEVALSVSNLLRLNLLRNVDNPDGIPNNLEVDLTYLGEEFLRICSSEI